MPTDYQLNGLLYQKSTFTDVPTSQMFTYRSNDIVMNDFLDDSQVFGRQWMFVHEGIHCGEDVCWRHG